MNSAAERNRRPSETPSPTEVRRAVGDAYRDESRRILATLIRLVKDFDVAEDAMQEAFAAAMAQWQEMGVPTNPRAWLFTTARYKAIDAIRRRERQNVSLSAIAEALPASADSTEFEIDECEDDRLKLIFACNNPALAPEARIALTLREVCGLTTEEIAQAFLISPTTLAQRIVRAKSKIRDAGIPYRVPGPDELPDRLDTVLHVVYLVFTRGYSAPWQAGQELPDLAAEGIRLARLVNDLLPAPEVQGLLALLLLQHSRRDARVSPSGSLIVLEEQDRSLWNTEQIAEGKALLQKARASATFGPYTLQAAIAAVHADSATAADTDWPTIVRLYDALLAATPSPVIELNRAVAIAMNDGLEAAIPIVDRLLEQSDLAGYCPAHCARGALYRRAGRFAESLASYRAAAALSQPGAEREFIEGQIVELSN